MDGQSVQGVRFWTHFQDLVGSLSPKLFEQFHYHGIIAQSKTPQAGSIDATLFEDGMLAINAYVKVARKPGTANQFVAGVLTWPFDFATWQLKLLTQLRHYTLPL